MRTIDLSHTISEEMPVYPGTEPPLLSAACTLEKDGFRETLLRLYSHTGTHIDAPAHLIAGGETLDRFAAAQFIGSALIIDCSALETGTRIGMDFIEKNRARAEKAEFLLFRTGWARFWGMDAYFKDFPCITAELADYLAAQGKKGVGFDAISIDPVGAPLENHRVVLGTGRTLILENLTALEAVGTELFTLVAAPLKFRDADGAPARVFAICE